MADILENIDPSQVHISEDSRIYFKDETCGAMFSEIDRAVEVVTEEQNRVVNSGRKLFQEGQKFEREAVAVELRSIMFIHQHQWPEPDEIRVCERCKEQVEKGSPCTASTHYTCHQALDDLLQKLEETKKL